MPRFLVFYFTVSLFSAPNVYSSDYQSVASISDGVFESPSEFVFSSNQEYMYVASANGIVVVELDESGNPTSNTSTFSDFGDGESAAGFGEGLVLSPSGEFLYWAGQINNSGQYFHGLVAFSVDTDTGLLTHYQTLGFDASSGVNTGSSETIMVSPDGKFLYSHNPYGDPGYGLFLIYSLHAETGAMAFVDQYDLGDVGVNYEHNFDLSFDGEYLIYAYSDYSNNGAQIVVLDRNPIAGLLSEVSRTTWAEVSSLSDLTVKSSKSDGSIYVYSGGTLSVFTIDELGVMTWLYNESTPNYDAVAAMSLDVNNSNDQIVVMARDSNDKQLIDNFRLSANSNQFEFSERIENLNILSFRIRFNESQDNIVWLGHSNDRVYYVDRNNVNLGSIVEYPFGDFGLENFSPLYVNDNSLLGSGVVGTVINTIDLMSNAGEIEVQSSMLSESYRLYNNFVAVNSELAIGLLVHPFPRTTTVEFYQKNPLDGSFSISDEFILGDGSNSYDVFKAESDPSGSYLISFERSSNTSGVFGLVVYQIDSTNHNLGVIDAVLWSDVDANSSFPSFWFTGAVKLVFYEQSNAFSMGNKLFRFNGSEITFLGDMSSPADTDLFVADDGVTAFSVESDGTTSTINSYSIDLSATEANTFLTEAGTLNGVNGSITPLFASNGQMAYVTDSSQGQLAIGEIKYNANLDLFAPVIANVIPLNTITPDGVAVKAYQADDNANVFWLLLQGGQYETIKLSRTFPPTQLFSFNYTFDASERGTQGHVMSGVFEGILQEDNDTIVIESFVAGSLAGFDYLTSGSVGMRAADPSAKPQMSLSGDTVDFWICPQGFSAVGDNGNGDCSFGSEGGFLISPYVNTNTGDCIAESSPGICELWAWAGIPELGDDYRDGDIPYNKANWSAVLLGDAIDSDGDSIFDLLDFDDDNDNIDDVDDAFPLIAIGNLLDSDNDGAPNECDSDCLALGMTADNDDDNDGIADVDDPFPLNSNSVPPPPVISSLNAEDGALMVRFSPNGDGGSSILDYTVTCGDTSVTSTQSPIRIEELENDVSYSCTVKARNILGSSLASDIVIGTPEGIIRSGLNIPLLKVIIDAQSAT
ncbi:beta-propeller fold lactonase family protein [Paraglaciecola arctica]|uniref:beta-propeller fold lactonase family protein n=1 Tax=Paraglaciecola arctica TaxID=1128911 RepID=UPI001C07AF52|nr:beta-propeller fold lactonase family protein [Paraglaciecola arctica]MBU3004212.1 beta-propeller fold lactonase family protein [Paraglaciecola arctica]